MPRATRPTLHVRLYKRQLKCIEDGRLSGVNNRVDRGEYRPESPFFDGVLAFKIASSPFSISIHCCAIILLLLTSIGFASLHLFLCNHGLFLFILKLATPELEAHMPAFDKPILKESLPAKINVKLGDDFDEKTKNDIWNGKSASAESSLADAGGTKRKRKPVKDLRFEDLNMLGTHSKRKERKKEFLQERKQKYKKSKMGETPDFPGREEIRFGEVVQAPPKLLLPKVSKFSLDVSKERFRLQAIESYRKRRGWISRPGIKLH